MEALTEGRASDIASHMRSSRLISGVYRFLLGAVLVCSLLLLPPSSAHAQGGMHEVAAATQHSSHDNHRFMPEHMETGAVATAQGGDLHSHEGDPCCGGICLSAALFATHGETVTAVHTVHVGSTTLLLVSVEARGLLRPPRA